MIYILDTKIFRYFPQSQELEAGRRGGRGLQAVQEVKGRRIIPIIPSFEPWLCFHLIPWESGQNSHHLSSKLHI